VRVDEPAHHGQYNRRIDGHELPDGPVRGAELERAHVVAIGQRIRAAREGQGTSLRELARRVGVSPSLISQIETGKAQPSVGTLYSLTTALRLSVDSLFTTPGELGAAGPAQGGVLPPQPEEIPRLVVRAQERKVIDLDSGVRWERLTSTSHPDVDFLSVVYEVGGASAESMMRHAGREFGTVLAGVLTVTVNFDDHVLHPGDSIAFPSTTPHRLWNAGNVPVHAIWVVVGRHGVAGTHGSPPT
jgi:transcriptional regulator with XRE-family HTH domain